MLLFTGPAGAVVGAVLPALLPPERGAVTTVVGARPPLTPAGYSRITWPGWIVEGLSRLFQAIRSAGVMSWMRASA
ncbi:hypothetical protein G6F35_018024 [Rhizopus arrhizus]|nr:hypothetical protein G6F35_018024 [Rhizopus arrhizus]